MNTELKEFINENIDLINENTEESWEEIYNKIHWEISGEFTETILDARINDPAEILGYIPESYFHNSKISNYKIPNNVTMISNDAFFNCNNLTSVIVGGNVTTIGKNAFAYCSNLKSIKIGDSVTSIGNDTFFSCGSLTSVYIADIKAWCNISFKNYSANPLYNGANLYLNNELVTELVIPNTVTEIKACAFYNYSSLESVKIPDSVTTIGQGAFFGCSNLAIVMIPHSVTIIDSFAFEDCNRLKELKFEGTEAEWKLITKGYGQHWGSSIQKIICTDGVIEL